MVAEERYLPKKRIIDIPFLSSKNLKHNFLNWTTVKHRFKYFYQAEFVSGDCKSTTSHENNGEDLAESSNTKCTDYCEDYDEEEDFEDSYEKSWELLRLRNQIVQFIFVHINVYYRFRKKIKISKIFYGTRTHKQIEQVVRELRKTSYRHKK